MTGLPEYIGREVAPMTAADIILIFIGIIGLLIAFGSFIIAVTKVRTADLQFSLCENLCLFSTEIRITSEKNNAHPGATRMGASH